MIPAEAYIMPLGDVIVKAVSKDSDSKRVVEVQASSEDVDLQGDVVLQSALLDSAESFVKSGHLDIDHLSEIGDRLGLRDPPSYIVGRPMEVKDVGGKKTSVVGEIMRGSKFDPDHNRFDSLWKSLQSDPPVKWSASIYGFPTKLTDCTEKSCTNGATRYVVEKIDWRSLAFTRNPINNSMSGYARVTTAKAMIESMQSSMRKDNILPFMTGSPDAAPSGMMHLPYNLDHMWGQHLRHSKECSFLKAGNSVTAFKDHYMVCCGAGSDMAEILAHAIMYAILRDRHKNSK